MAPTSYWLTRAVFLRFLGLVYAFAFLSLVGQLAPLIGADGLTPAREFLERNAWPDGPGLASFIELPTLFWLDASDAFMLGAGYVGLLLSLLLLAGFASALQLAVLWFLYLSFVHVGQIWYGYGWEILLLETGFLSIFLCPLLRGAPLPENTPPPAAVIWLLRWLLFRVMFGAGLIKLRGDPCWRDLTCLVYHYETQPLPNPLSWWLHQAPPWFHQGGVLFNHLVELVVPFFIFGPRRVRHVAGAMEAAFQVTLILSGNLSWLNWLTLSLCVSCFDDTLLQRFFPARIRERVAALAAGARPSLARRVTTGALVLIVAALSVNPVANMLSPRQIMNTSFDRLHIVNTYGAFGSIGKVRHEVILEGTDAETLTSETRWREYEFKCKPGDVMRRPCVVAPYQYRIDWQVWFAAMSSIQRHGWLLALSRKLLEGDAGARGLFANDPFAEEPPRYIRAELYEYRFTRFGDGTDAWWTRTRVASYFPPLSLDDLSPRKPRGREGGAFGAPFRLRER